MPALNIEAEELSDVKFRYESISRGSGERPLSAHKLNLYNLEQHRPPPTAQPSLLMVPPLTPAHARELASAPFPDVLFAAAVERWKPRRERHYPKTGGPRG